VSGTVNPQGASTKVSFQFGTTTAYGQVTSEQSTAVSNVATPFAAALTGLPAGTTIHYRAVAVSDFGTFLGADQTLVTASSSLPPAPPPGTIPVVQARASATAKANGSSASVRVSCVGAAGATCRLAFRLTVTETFKGHRLVAVGALSNGHRIHKLVVVGNARVLLTAGQTRTVRVALNRTGVRLLGGRHKLKVRLRVTQATATASVATVANQTITFTRARKANASR
jgi:hypothetical protein